MPTQMRAWHVAALLAQVADAVVVSPLPCCQMLGACLVGMGRQFWNLGDAGLGMHMRLRAPGDTSCCCDHSGAAVGLGVCFLHCPAPQQRLCNHPHVGVVFSLCCRRGGREEDEAATQGVGCVGLGVEKFWVFVTVGFQLWGFSILFSSQFHWDSCSGLALGG
jgi:hypothetical protein